MRIGIDFGGTNTKFGLFEEDGSTNKFFVRKLADLRGGQDLPASLLEETKKFIGGAVITSGGLSVKGLIDRKLGMVINDIGAGDELAGIDLKDFFSTELNVPFAVDNDARSYAYGEWKYGAGRDFNSVIVITLGTGVGCAAVIDGKLFGSENPMSGVLGGHLSIDRNGDECPCGSKGCMELYCSAAAMEKKILKLFPELSSAATPLKEFFDNMELKAGYKNTAEKFFDDLAMGIINVVHAYGIDKVILGGGLMKSYKKIIPPVAEIVKKRAWTARKGSVEIFPAELEDKAACLGAAFLER